MKVEKAIAISDAKISFVSLVDKAANKKQFLITKAENGTAQFSTYGRIIKVDDETHYITGIVYEPMVEDAHGNFMTAEEIQKAAYWFAKNGDQVDVQHSFEEADGVAVVENYLAPCDMEIAGETVIKGSWLMTVEVTNSELWEAVQKGDITGFSMGGIGKYSEDDVDLSDLEKAEQKGETEMAESNTEKRGILKMIANAFGFGVVEKGDMLDIYSERQKVSGFWDAVDTMIQLLSSGHWDYKEDRYVYDFEENEEQIRTVLQEFSQIVTDVLASDSLTKALSTNAPAKPIYKTDEDVGKSNGQEENDVNEERVREIMKEELEKALSKQTEPVAKAEEAPATPAAETAEITEEAIQKMVDAALAKALGEEEPVAEGIDLEDMINQAVQKAVDPIYKARGIPTSLNTESDPVEKAEKPHYLNGIL